MVGSGEVSRINKVRIQSRWLHTTHLQPFANRPNNKAGIMINHVMRLASRSKIEEKAQWKAIEPHH